MENLTKREQRVIRAFLNCIRAGEYTEDYAITLIEDNARYGWLSDAAKEYLTQMGQRATAVDITAPR